MRSKIEKNSFQFDYFSSNYKNFEEDFYRVAKLNVPLTFLTDDILSLMVSTGESYFKLNATNAKDSKDHYFIFKRKENKDNSKVEQFEYIRHSDAINR